MYCIRVNKYYMYKNELYTIQNYFIEKISKSIEMLKVI